MFRQRLADEYFPLIMATLRKSKESMKILINTVVSGKPESQDVLNNVRHPAIPMVATVKPGQNIATSAGRAAGVLRVRLGKGRNKPTANPSPRSTGDRGPGWSSMPEA